MSEERTQGLAYAQPLDLDNEPEEPRRTVKLGGLVYTMQRAIDLSMAEQEEWRLVGVQIAAIKETPAGPDGFPSETQRDVLNEMELRLCALILDAPVDALPRELLSGEENAWRRNLLQEAFLEQPGTPKRLALAAAPAVQQAARLLQQRQQQNATTAAQPVRLAPLQQPENGTRKSRRGSSTATAGT